MSAWQYDEGIDPSSFYGFIYLMTHKASGRMYIGRKCTTLKRGKVRVPS